MHLTTTDFYVCHWDTYYLLVCSLEWHVKAAEIKSWKDVYLFGSQENVWNGRVSFFSSSKIASAEATLANTAHRLKYVINNIFADNDFDMHII